MRINSALLNNKPSLGFVGSKFFATNPKSLYSIISKKLRGQSACNTTALYRKSLKYGIYEKSFVLRVVNSLIYLSTLLAFVHFCLHPVQ